MSKLTLLDDQPAEQDLLHFQRYLHALEKTVFARDATTPLVVGVFGAWGSGKSTLLGMLEKHLAYTPDPQKAMLEQAAQKSVHPWVVVKFSPWLYRNEPSLLLPLLATLAKELPAFEKLIKNIVKFAPDVAKKLAAMGMEAATTGLPLLSFLSSLNGKSVAGETPQVKDLQQQIAEAVKAVTGDDKRLVFLIDDLDRCHDSKQIVNLLEQIKLFLHLDRCLFFIAADRAQIVKAIDKEFAGAGEAYLEKFVQLPFELPPHQSQHLVGLLGVEDELKKSFRSLCEVLGNNPRKVKQLWNQAVVALAVLNEEKDRVNGKAPDPHLLLKWLLLKDCGELKRYPYHYLQFEREKNRDAFIKVLDFKDEKGEWRSKLHQKLAVYLWNDLDAHKFGNPNTLSLYAYSCAERNAHARSLIETSCFTEEANFTDWDFQEADLSGGHFHGAVFTHCDFQRADFSHADLSEVKFINCQLAGACFDEAEISRTTWKGNVGMHEMDSEPDIYSQIIDKAINDYREYKLEYAEVDPHFEWLEPESLFKAPKTILNLHQAQGTLTDTIRADLVNKGKAIKRELGM